MPYAINPNDYNVDFLNTKFMGDVTSLTYMSYLLEKNIPDLPTQLVSGPSGNFTTKKGDAGKLKSINYVSLKDAGSIDGWFLEGNYFVDTYDISYQNPSQNVGSNQYGPETIGAYNEPQLIPDDTGFIQYPTSVGGNINTELKNELLNKQLNLGPGSAIDFDSPLNDIAKERRKEEAINRVKLNTLNQTAGKLNMDPFGLLAGQDLVLKDYDITVRPGFIGKLFSAVSDITNVNAPTSPIPDGAFGNYGEDGPEEYRDLMKSTGSATKGLIFDAISKNKYGPILEEPKGKLANFLGVNQAPQPKKYTDPLDDEYNKELKDEKGKSSADKKNKKEGGFINNLLKKVGVGTEKDPQPSEFSNPTIEEDNISKNSTYGFDSLDNDYTKDTWDGPDGPIGTKKPIDIQSTNPVGTKNDVKSYDKSMYWGQQTTNPFKKGILKYTQDLINNSKTNKQQDKARFIGVTNDTTNFEEKTGRHKTYSMGNTVRSEDSSFYCRSWSVRNPYRKVSDLIRHGVDGGKQSLTRDDFNLSVLGKNGFVKVAPYVTDVNKRSGSNNLNGGKLMLGDPTVQKYMLSIENLAWQNSEQMLLVPPCEVGPNGGRIMWFPPYDITFTDNSSINWDTTTFIGRGEPIYTYNSTERTGTLGFKIVVDHSMAVATLKENGAETLYRYFAGCSDIFEAASVILPKADIEETKVQEKEQSNDEPKTFETTTPTKPEIEEVRFYFRNARNYSSDPIGTNIETETNDGYLMSGSDQRNLDGIDKLEKIMDFLLTPDGKRYKIQIKGLTSEAGTPEQNQDLSLTRANSVKDFIYKSLVSVETGEPLEAQNLGLEKTYPTETTWKNDTKRWEVIAGGEGINYSITTDPNTGLQKQVKDDDKKYGNAEQTVPEAVDYRSVIVKLIYDEQIDSFMLESKNTEELNESTNNQTQPQQEKNEKIKNEETIKRITEKSLDYLSWECSYFEEMAQDTPFVYEQLTEKLKYFHPAFHSMTPQGFNSRLTFLKQCTRQGPSIDAGGPSNLAFGKPPICVLRVGDFYHTKIVIDSVNFTFDPLIWDLNPEGIGVQPMVCTVDLNFKFIGGSSLGGPISQLQNAVGFNFFANTGLYNPRTLFSSVEKYNVTKPDSNNGLPTEISDFEINSVGSGGSKKFGYGAYISPNVAQDENGKFVKEGDIITPPTDASEKTNQQNQAEAQVQSNDAQMDNQTKENIENANQTNETVDNDVKILESFQFRGYRNLNNSETNFYIDFVYLGTGNSGSLTKEYNGYVKLEVTDNNKIYDLGEFKIFTQEGNIKISLNNKTIDFGPITGEKLVKNVEFNFNNFTEIVGPYNNSQESYLTLSWDINTKVDKLNTDQFNN